MSSLPHWNPFRSLQPVTDVEDLFRSLSLRPLFRGMDPPLEMRIDVKEDEKAYRMSADIPGVQKEDIEVSVDGSQVSIEAEFKREDSREGAKELHSERLVGRTYRAFSLPQEIDSTLCEAKYDGGVLTLTLPKKSSGQSARISVT